MDPKLSPGLCIATKCSIVDPLGPLFYMSAEFLKQSFFKIVSKGFNLTVLKIPLQKLIYFQRIIILEYFVFGGI